MNHDDVIRMAREAGYGDAMADLHAPALERFAALVAAHVRKTDEDDDDEVDLEDEPWDEPSQDYKCKCSQCRRIASRTRLGVQNER